jgi:molybdopterin-containing oxidoreductase family iron-sulfur binding subunit
MAKRYGLAIDLERCIGCHTCTIACKLENGIEKGSWIKVRTIGGPHPDTPSGVHPELSMHFLPMLCMHCDRPPCIDACPLQAISKRGDGIVLVDEEKCDGCQACLSACPYEALMYDEDRGVARKCTLCAHRVDEGLEPFCLVCCETEAIYFGDLEDPDSPVARIVARRRAEVLQPELGTEPAVYYCPTRHGRIL